VGRGERDLWRYQMSPVFVCPVVLGIMLVEWNVPCLSWKDVALGSKPDAY